MQSKETGTKRAKQQRSSWTNLVGACFSFTLPANPPPRPRGKALCASSCNVFEPALIDETLGLDVEPDFVLLAEISLEARWCLSHPDHEVSTERDMATTITRTWAELEDLGYFSAVTDARRRFRTNAAERREAKRALLATHPDKGGRAEEFAVALQKYRSQNGE